jgi:hypothetical protein
MLFVRWVDNGLEELRESRNSPAIFLRTRSRAFETNGHRGGRTCIECLFVDVSREQIVVGLASLNDAGVTLVDEHDRRS